MPCHAMLCPCHAVPCPCRAVPVPCRADIGCAEGRACGFGSERSSLPRQARRNARPPASLPCGFPGAPRRAAPRRAAWQRHWAQACAWRRRPPSPPTRLTLDLGLKALGDVCSARRRRLERQPVHRGRGRQLPRGGTLPAHQPDHHLRARHHDQRRGHWFVLSLPVALVECRARSLHSMTCVYTPLQCSLSCWTDPPNFKFEQKAAHWRGYPLLALALGHPQRVPADPATRKTTLTGLATCTTPRRTAFCIVH